jgi:hypothetical protein
MYMLHVYEISNLDNGIDGVLVSVFAASAVDPGFEPNRKSIKVKRIYDIHFMLSFYNINYSICTTC